MKRGAIFRELLSTQRRSLPLWMVSIVAVSAGYTSLYPYMERFDLEGMIDVLPPAMIEAMGYDQLGTAAGYIQSAVWGLVALALLIVFAIATGSKFVAGEEESGALELELTSPVPRAVIYGERLALLWFDVVVLVAALAGMTGLLVTVLGLGVEPAHLLAASVQLALLVGMHGTVAFGVGAATGRRAAALGAASGLVVVGWMTNALGPTIGQDWLAAVSPFGWYMEANALEVGLNPVGVALLLAVSVAAGGVGAWRFVRRDLMV